MAPPRTYELIEPAWTGAQLASVDTSFNNWGLLVNFATDGYIVGFRYFRGDNTMAGNRVAWIRNVATTELLSLRAFPRLTSGTGSTGWQTRYFRPYFKVKSGDQWRIGHWQSTLRMYFRSGFISSAHYTSGDLTLPHDTSSVANASVGLDFNTPTSHPTVFGSVPGIDIVFMPARIY